MYSFQIYNSTKTLSSTDLFFSYHVYSVFIVVDGEHEVTVHFYCNCNCIEKYTVTLQLHYSCLKRLGCP